MFSDILELLHSFDLFEFLQSFGSYAMWIVFLIVFAESGLFFGFFLPGDSLLFTAGVLASQGFINIFFLCIGSFIAAVVGDSVGYWFGHTYGKKFFNNPESWIRTPDHITKAEAFYKKHGKKTIILARFVPAVRTFAPIVAGIGSMDYKTFLSYNIVGGLLWGVGMTVAGFFLGSLIPAEKVDKLLLPIIAVIVVASVLPAIHHVWQERQEAKKHQS